MKITPAKFHKNVTEVVNKMCLVYNERCRIDNRTGEVYRPAMENALAAAMIELNRQKEELT